MANPNLLTRLLCVLATAGCLFAGSGILAAADGRKPEKTVLRPGHESNRITVKFRDGHLGHRLVKAPSSVIDERVDQAYGGGGLFKHD